MSINGKVKWFNGAMVSLKEMTVFVHSSAAREANLDEGDALTFEVEN